MNLSDEDRDLLLGRRADCHPDQKHYCKGLCFSCYGKTPRHKAAVRKWQLKNPEKCKAIQKKHYSTDAYRAQRKENRVGIVRDKANAATKAWRSNNLDRIRQYKKIHGRQATAKNNTIKWAKFGFSFPQYYEMLRKQSGLCAICQRWMDRPCVDHNHETNKVRGLLCNNCNRGIGLLSDSAWHLDRAVQYLTYNPETSMDITPEDNSMVVSCIEMMVELLMEHNHEFTSGERALIERSMYILTGSEGRFEKEPDEGEEWKG